LNSKVKGSNGEREVANILKEHGYLAHKGIQYDTARFEADVEGLPGIHIEVKRVEKLNIYEAMKQSERDAKEGEMPTVMHRRNRDEWKVTMLLTDWLKLYEAWGKHNGNDS